MNRGSRWTVLVAAALAGCDANTAPRTVSGEWAGSATEANAVFLFDVNLQDAGGTISGSARVDGVSNNCLIETFEVTGARSGSAVTLTFSCPNYTPFTFDGDLSRNGATLQGTLDGSGFDDTTLNLARSE